MNKNIKSIILPLAVIVIGLLIGGVFLINQQLDSQNSNAVTVNNNENARLLSVEAPGMFCVGCSAAVEGYVGTIDGVKSVSADLASKKVEVVYDASVVTKDKILASQIFDAYGRNFLSDEEFSGDNLESSSSTILPPAIILKLQKVGAKTSQLDSLEEYQDQFDNIDKAIVDEEYTQAGELLDELLNQLQENE